MQHAAIYSMKKSNKNLNCHLYKTKKFNEFYFSHLRIGSLHKPQLSNSNDFFFVHRVFRFAVN
jgi:hypothetical protein